MSRLFERTLGVDAIGDLRDGVLDCRIVPYRTEAHVADVLADGRVDKYREAFAEGAFDHQVNANEPGVVRRVSFIDSHEGDKLGYAIRLRSGADSLHGELRVLPTRVDDVRQMLADGVTGLSVGFLAVRGGTRDVDGVRLRTKAQLVHVALVAQPAYADAQVLAARADESEADDLLDPERAAEYSELERARSMHELETRLAAYDADLDAFAKAIESMRG